jgi:hypothetical protein
MTCMMMILFQFEELLMGKNITYQQFMLAKITWSAGSSDVVGE